MWQSLPIKHSQDFTLRCCITPHYGDPLSGLAVLTLRIDFPIIDSLSF